MKKEKEQQPEAKKNLSDTAGEGNSSQAEAAATTSPAINAGDQPVTEAPEAGSDFRTGETSPELENQQESQNGQDTVPVVVSEAQPSIEEMQDRFLRLAADFANYKRRKEAERLEIADYARREFVLALLPIVDDFALMVEYDAEHPERLAEGARLIRQKMMELLAKQGLEKIEALQQPFDYQRHEAVLMQPVQDKALDHVVLSVMQEGYLFKDKVLRPSKVIVGQYLGEEASAPQGENDAEKSKEAANKAT